MSDSTDLLSEVEINVQAVAERAHRRRRFLVDSVELLSSSLDYTATLTSLANLAVPQIADWCAIDIVGDDGSIGTAAVAHVDPAKVALARRLQARIPADPNAQHGAPHVIRTGAPEIVHEIDDERLANALPDADLLEIMRGLGLRSSMCVPLKARGQILGAISLVSAESDRPFDEDDLALAEDLASRAALAIDNARLYEQAKRAAAEWAAVMERIGDALIFVNTRRQITFMNDTARRLLGADFVGGADATVTAAIPIFTWDGQLFPPDDHPSQRALLGEVVSDAEWLLVRPDGGQVFCEGSASPVDSDDGTRLGAVVAWRDVTERKQGDEERRRLSAELEMRVIKRTAELDSANKELEAFAYSVSHDLRAPLRSMDGFSQVLLEKYVDSLDERGVRYLNHIRNAAQEMGELIDALLELSRVTRGELRREIVDLSDLARTIATQLRESDPDRQAIFTISEGLTVTGDAQLLHALLENLLNNAWKYTRNCNQARIEVGVEEQHSTPVYFVRDNGAGFDMTYMSKLFVPFQRLHDARDFEGTGVGLATVQRVVHRHHGRVWAEGAVDEGATFYFTLSADGAGLP